LIQLIPTNRARSNLKLSTAAPCRLLDHFFIPHGNGKLVIAMPIGSGRDVP
jgi:hypothetical protein